MPFSRLPKARQLQRELTKKEQELQQLKEHVNQLEKQKTPTLETVVPPTPQRDAVRLLQEVSVTPSRERVRALLPYTETVSRVKKASTSLKQTLFSEKTTTKRSGISKAISTKIKLSRDYIFRKRAARNMRASIARSQRVMVADFLKRPDNSYELPAKKDQIRGHGKFALTDTLSHLHSKFSQEFPEIKISKAAFCKVRPKNVTLVCYTKRRQCLCQRHANVALKVQAAKVLPRSAEQLVGMSDIEIRKKMEDIPDEEVKYISWLRSDVEYNGKTIKKVKLCDVKQKKEEFIQDFMTAMPEFRNHCQRITAQYTQVRVLKESLLPEREITVQMDYSENWSSKFQDEISSVYYDKSQISLHPMVVHSKTAEGKLVAQSYVGVSSEGNHTAPTTYAFVTALIKEVKGHFPSLTTIHFITDSPSSQYRNRTIIALIAKFPAIFGLKASWSWLEAGHGKGPCDGVGGSVKKKADNLIKSGVIIRDANEFCQAFEGSSSTVKLLHVNPATIAESKKVMERWQPAPVPGLMSIHSVVPAGSTLMMRETSCFRACCYHQGGNFHPSCEGWRQTNVNVTYPTDVTLTEQTEIDIENNDNTEGTTTEQTEIDYDERDKTEGTATEHTETDSAKTEGTTTEQMETNYDDRDKTEGTTTELTETDNDKDKREVTMTKQTETDNDSDKTEGITTEQTQTDSDDRDATEGPTVSVSKGSYIITPYGKRWYLAKVLHVNCENMITVSYMKPTRGKWKWGQQDTGDITQDEILMIVSHPHSVGNLVDIKDEEKKEVQERFQQFLASY